MRTQKPTEGRSRCVTPFSYHLWSLGNIIKEMILYLANYMISYPQGRNPRHCLCVSPREESSSLCMCVYSVMSLLIPECLKRGDFKFK